MRYLFILAFLIFLTEFSIAQNITRIEPPNWWTGLKDSSLQIMLHGHNIGHLEAEVEEKGIQLQSTQRVENPNYLFIDLVILPECQPGKFNVILSDKGREVTRFNYELLGRDAGSSVRHGFNSTDVIYLITPDRYSNGNPLNDDLPDLQDKFDRTNPLGRHGGDIVGIINHLDYIKDMGFTAIWLNPVLENRMPRHSYHGYAITDFYTVDPRFGSNTEYKALCTRASEMGIKIIMDMVLNHCGLHHWWMKDLPTKDWINHQGKEYHQTNHKKTLNLDPYAAKSDKDLLMEGWFVPTMPDLNLRNPFLGKYMIQNTIWWIEFAGLGGIRMDTYPYPDESYMSDWSGAVMKEYPNFNITGEAWHDDPAIVSYWQKDKVNINGYSSQLPSLCDFPLQHALYKSLNTESGWNDQWNMLYEMLAKDYHYPHPQELVVFADNHDMDRIFTQVKNDVAKFKMAMAYVLTVRGIPQIYYGTEILISNQGTDNHGVIRADFPGGWKNDSINAFTRMGLEENQTEAQNFIKKVVNWRKTSKAIQHGKTIHYAPQDNIYVYFRQHGEEIVMVILNRNETGKTLKLDRFASNIPRTPKVKDVLADQDMNLDTELILQGPGPTILEWKAGQ